MEKKTSSLFGLNEGMKVYMKTFENPKQRKELLKNLAIGSEFNLRHRGLFEYYGKDFITYKLENRSSSKRNEFLRLISQYMAYYLEDDCPPSWNDCDKDFWEYFILVYYPQYMKITPKQNDTKRFFQQLEKFIHWLDERYETKLYLLIKDRFSEMAKELMDCEKLLNAVFIKDFPDIYQPNWDSHADVELLNARFEKSTDHIHSLFIVNAINENNLVQLTDLESKRTYLLIELPAHLIKVGMFMSGIIIKMPQSLYWNWHLTEGFFSPTTPFSFLEE